MNEQTLTFKSKTDLLGVSDEPSTCVDAEPYALQVLDDSMDPEFWAGSIIVVDPTGRASHGSYVLAELPSRKPEGKMSSNQDAYVFRELIKGEDGTCVLKPLNKSYESVEIDSDLSTIVGVIVQRAGTRRSHHKRYN